MEVFITQFSGRLTDDGTKLRARARVNRVDVGMRYMDFSEFGAFYQAHLVNGIQVGDSSDVVLISGGRKSINRELSNNPLLLTPAPGQSLSIRIIVQHADIQQNSALQIATAPVIAARQGHARGGDFFSQVAFAGKVFTGIHDAVHRNAKKFAFLQIYSGPPLPGDRSIHNGHNPVNTQAIVNQLRGIAGWRAD